MQFRRLAEQANQADSHQQDVDLNSHVFVALKTGPRAAKYPFIYSLVEGGGEEIKFYTVSFFFFVVLRTFQFPTN